MFFKKHFYIYPVIILVLLGSCKVSKKSEISEETEVIEATILNLDFEQISSDGKPKMWWTGGEGYEVITDGSVVYSGKYSLKITYLKGSNFGCAVSTFPLGDALGKTLKFMGYIKTSDITRDWCGLWMRVDGPNDETLAFDNMSDRGVYGNRDWQKYEIQLEVANNAVNIYFGALHTGNGIAWFDAFSFEIDGKEYNPPLLFSPNESQLAWLKQNAQQFTTEEPSSGFSDLQFLKDMVGSAYIVSLGEGTHGTREFFKMKHRIVEFLTNEMEFTLFGIEANMPECRTINRYVLYGEGNAREALAGIYFWTWNTEEVLDMIEWMREYNASGKGPIQFFGFDMQFPTIAMLNVQNFIQEVDPTLYSQVLASYDIVRQVWADLEESYSDENINPDFASWQREAQSVLDLLKQNQERYTIIKSEMDVEWAIQDALVVLQGASQDQRDQFMAENVKWILDHSPQDSKIALWAHNGHVNKLKGWMGSYLDQWYGKNMVVFGFCFHKGTYSAYGFRGLGTYGTDPSEVGTAEWAFYLTGYPRFILDLRLASIDDPASSWLTQPILFRSIGAAPIVYAFSTSILTEEYDVLIFFEESNPTILLPRFLSSPTFLCPNRMPFQRYLPLKKGIKSCSIN